MKYRYSSIDTAFRCLRKYYLDYVEQAPRVGPPSIELEFGTAMHTGLQACLEGDDAIATFKAFWASMEGDFEHQARDYAFLSELGPEFLRKFSRLHAKKIKPLHIEQRLSAKIGGIDFEGTPDVLCEYQGVPSVLDFKTSQYHYPKEKIRIGIQMPLYAKMAEVALGFKAKQIVYYVFVKGQSVIQTLVEPLTDELQQRALGMAVGKAIELTDRGMLPQKAVKSYPQNPTACIMGKKLCDRFGTCYPEAPNDGRTDQD